MTNILEENHLHIHKGMLCEGLKKSAGKPKILDEDRLFDYLRTRGVKKERLFALCEEILDFVKTHVSEEHQPEDDLSSMFLEKAKELNPFKDMFQFEDEEGAQQLVYNKKPNGNVVSVCCLADFANIKTVKDYFYAHDMENLSILCEQLTPLINPKKPELVSEDDVLQKVINVLKPHHKFPKIKINRYIHPVVLSTHQHIPALKYLPFAVQDVTIEDLNPYLKDFLLRVRHHEYLCAMIYTNLIGNKTPYVIYLHGEGDDGKSGFVDMLVHLIKSKTSYDSNERFGAFNMINYALILHNEANKGKYLLQDEALKAATGNDWCQIERKNGIAFQGKIRGQFIVTSNHKPIIIGTKDEKRRIRYFFVKGHGKKNKEIKGSDEILQELIKTPNEFLNYCRHCYDKHKTDSGELIQDLPNFDETIRHLRDVKMSIQFEEIFNKLFKEKRTFELHPEGKCSALDLVKAIKDIDSSTYAVTNFIGILNVDYGVKEEEGQYIGIQKRQRKE